MNLDYKFLMAIQIVWILVALRHYLRRSDEVPLLASLMIGYYASYRLWTYIAGLRARGGVGNLGFTEVTDPELLVALNAIVLGESILLGVYMLVQDRVFPTAEFSLAPTVSRRLQSLVFWAAVVLLPTSYYIRDFVYGVFRGGFATTFAATAYIRLFPLVLSTVAILLIFLWKYGRLDGFTRLMNLGLVVALFFATYRSQGRFQFLAWLLAGGLIVTATLRPVRRLLLLTVCMTGVALAFAMAGAQRTGLSDSESSEAWSRIVRAEDANMLDGFALMQQVIPSKFGYRYGMEHLETLIRPIPRAWWPSKPVGNYMLKAAGIDETQGATIGISPSLFGSFYVEAGYIGIVVLSALYGFIIGRFMRWATTMHPAAALLVRGLVCACSVPLLRGGDLAGIVAILMMSFWPFILLLLFRRRHLASDSPWFSTAVPAMAMAPARTNRQTRPRRGATGGVRRQGLRHRQF